MSDYNGWSNRATWNVSLWLNNEEPLYHALQGIVRRADCVEGLADDIDGFCSEIWPNGITPDGDLLSECDWEEVAKAEWEDADKDKETV